MKVTGPEIRTKKKFLAVDEACIVMLGPTPGFKSGGGGGGGGGGTFVSSGFSNEGDLNFYVPSTPLRGCHT